MAARPYWKGQLKLALVTIPVELYSAQKSGPTIAFHQVHQPSGKRIRYEKVVPGIGPVPAEEIAKGFETAKGEYVLLTDKELEAVRLESRKTLDLTRFVDADDIDPIYFERPYFLIPSGDLAQEAFVVMRDAMRKARKVGIGQLALRGREQLVAIRPCGRGMILETLRYAEEMYKASSYFRDIEDVKADPELLELATNLIERKSGSFDAGEFRDHYVEAVRELIEARRKDRTLRVEDEPRPEGGNVIDLMAALKRSVQGGKAAPAAKGKAAPKEAEPKQAAPKKSAARKPAAKKSAA